MEAKLLELPRRKLLGFTMGSAVGWLASGCSPSKPQEGRSSAQVVDTVSRLRSQVTQLEPAYQRTYRVSADGNGGAFRAIKDACAAILKDMQEDLDVRGQVQAQSNPWLYRKIEVLPGDYDELVVIPPHTALVGMGRQPEDVRIHTGTHDNVFATTGRSTYVRNVHFEHTTPDQEAHPHRDAGSSGDAGLKDAQRRTIIFDSVRFTSPRKGGPGQCTNDMAPSSGTTIVFTKCIFDGPGQPQSVNLVTNRGEMGARSDYFFLQNRVISNFESHPDAARGQLGPLPAAPVGVPDFGAKRADRFVWIDGSFNVGVVGGVQAMIVMPYVGEQAHTRSRAPKQTTQYYIENAGSSQAGATLKFEGGTHRQGSFDPTLTLPSRGSSDLERAFYGPRPSDKRRLVSGVAAKPPLRVKKGDTYWVRIDPKGEAVSAVAISITGISSSQAIGACALDEGGRPTSDGNGIVTGNLERSEASAERMEVPRRWFYPGQGPVWVGVSFAEDASVEASAADEGQAMHGTGDSPVTVNLSRMPKGALVPRVTLHSELPPRFPK